MNQETRNALAQAARNLLHSVQGRDLAPEQLAQHSVQLAATLLKLSTQHRSTLEAERGRLLGRMMTDPRGQTFTTLLADRALRTSSAELSVDQARYLLRELGAPRYLTPIERLQLGLLNSFGGIVPTLAARGMLQRIRDQAKAYVLTGEVAQLVEYIARRAEQNIAVNVNHLGEEVIHEVEAQRRVEDYVALLQQPEVRTISVKVSSIYSQISALAFEQSVSTLCERLRRIYEAALAHSREGSPKLVYLDMEAYRDARLTFECFRRLLSEPGLQALQAGIVLQAYLPDSYSLQAELIAFAKQRTQTGGAPLRLRIVKGANLAMERLEADQRGWLLPTFPNKLETDANYKRMLLRATEANNGASLHVGVASHNLFDLCFGLLLRATRSSEHQLEFELLEGMADSLCRALVDVGASVLVYAPFVAERELPSALAYLVRRLDENTASENFLRHGFDMRVGDQAWEAQKRVFLDACHLVYTAPPPAYTGGRRHAPKLAKGAPFANEPDLDFVDAGTRSALEAELDAARTAFYSVRSQVPGIEARAPQVVPGGDPSRPGDTPYDVHLADIAVAERAIVNAVSAQERWRAKPPDERHALLAGVADRLRGRRLELIALMVLDAGKRPEEGDVEVSEAIDFAEYYPRSFRDWHDTPNVRLKGRGPTVVTPPWNFPLAIPMGGVFAALMAGNSVILKPALETALVAQRACELCWEAGIPRDVLQFVVCQDDVGSRLIRDPQVRVVVLTGSTETARLFRRLRPDIPLLAETGGKNALYVSPMADRELAIADITSSAFGHAGQKCSALSLLILHADVYDDANFLDSLRLAVQSLKVGSAWALDSRVTPLVQLPGQTQLRAFSELSEGESWLVEPRVDPGNPRLYGPGVKIGVRAGSYSHQTEFFCPVLSVARANDLKDALRIANGTPYGLTSGIHSLDEREQVEWLRGVHAGNVYVNRKITGAIVQRQPFGGWKDSSFGPGAKAGGPTYITQFLHAHAIAAPQAALPAAEHSGLRGLVGALIEKLVPLLDTAALGRLRAVAVAYQNDYLEHYSRARDVSNVRGEDNILRYTPSEPTLIVADVHTSLEMVARAVIAATICGTSHRVMLPDGAGISSAATALRADCYRSEADILDKLRRSETRRVRYLGTPSASWYAGLVAGDQTNCHTADGLPNASGRFELLHYLREQSWSVSTHRYGHLSPPSLRSAERASASAPPHGANVKS
jgi:RHH-type transcriptional regulator, proline utilization regulon repressor / proline dehydrogenase / delta 1-pyrroline-5-carboxylate dehydrogenase